MTPRIVHKSMGAPAAASAATPKCHDYFASAGPGSAQASGLFSLLPSSGSKGNTQAPAGEYWTQGRVGGRPKSALLFPTRCTLPCNWHLLPLHCLTAPFVCSVTWLNCVLASVLYKCIWESALLNIIGLVSKYAEASMLAYLYIYLGYFA